MRLNFPGAQPPRLLFGAPSRRTRPPRDAPNSECLRTREVIREGRTTAPEAGTIPTLTESFRLNGVSPHQMSGGNGILRDSRTPIYRGPCNGL